jgi:BirA family biotin operon repressor/biotin-[acetyl-CoA-carboxylase] ligase
MDLPLDARRISAAMAGQEIGGDVQVHEELESTSDHARELGRTGHAHGAVVLAEHQSAGRGRRENAWNASPRKNVLMSVLLRPEVRLELWPRITTLAALALSRAIRGHLELHPAIKWPNDIYVSNKKCAGILAETFSGPNGSFLVLGMGLNVNELEFSDELRQSATSLRLEIAGRPELDRSLLIINVLRQMNLLSKQWDAGFSGLIDEVRRRSWLLGQRVSARQSGDWIEGIATDLDDEGHLLLRDDAGNLLTLTSAEQVRPSP